MDDDTYTAVVDRFEDDQAVLLVEADDETVDERLLEKDTLPAAARQVDAVLSIELEDDSVVDITYDEQETTQRADDAQQRFDDLAQRPPTRDEESDSE